MITTSTSGVWELNEVYSKRNAERWRPDGVGLFSWGQNTYGQLGQDNRTYYSSPIQIPGNQWSNQQYKAGYNSSQSVSAIKTDETLWVWGYNGFGELGQGNRISYSSPVQIPGNQWKYVSNANISNGGKLATKTDGTLWAWGYNINGNLGQNNRTYYSSPVQIPGNQWNLISCNYFALATKTDGTLWTWGRNSYGQLGDNTTTQRNTPVTTFAGGTNWKQVSTGRTHCAAIKTDGTLWTWGSGGDGRLGDNATINRSTPVTTFAGGTNWKQVSGGNVQTAAIKTDGTLWVWGSSSSALGVLESNASKCTPVTTFAGSQLILLS